MSGTIIVNKSTAGSGKTRRILNDIDFIASTSSHKNSKRHALYLTFTRANIEEARVRLKKVLDMYLIRTIHSLCYEVLRWKYADYNYERFKETNISIAEFHTSSFTKKFKFKITMKEEGAMPKTKGDVLLSLYYKVRNNDIGLEEAFDYIKDDLLLRNIRWSDFERFYKAWTYWKEDEGYLDFSDLLDKVSVEDIIRMFEFANANGLYVYEDVFNLYIDEAQDLSEKMWKVIDKLIEGSNGRIENIMIVGDDDQSIYRFQGAEPIFIHTFPYYLARKYKLELKEKESYESYRCPENILKYSKQYSEKDLKAKREGGEVETGNIYDFYRSFNSL